MQCLMHTAPHTVCMMVQSNLPPCGILLPWWLHLVAVLASRAGDRTGGEDEEKSGAGQGRQSLLLETQCARRHAAASPSAQDTTHTTQSGVSASVRRSRWWSWCSCWWQAWATRTWSSPFNPIWGRTLGREWEREEVVVGGGAEAGESPGTFGWFGRQLRRDSISQWSSSSTPGYNDHIPTAGSLLLTIIQARVHTKPDSLCPYNATPWAFFYPNLSVLNLEPLA